MTNNKIINNGDVKSMENNKKLNAANVMNERVEKNLKVLSFGFNKKSNVYPLSIIKNESETKLRIKIESQIISFKIKTIYFVKWSGFTCIADVKLLPKYSCLFFFLISQKPLHPIIERLEMQYQILLQF